MLPGGVERAGRSSGCGACGKRSNGRKISDKIRWDFSFRCYVFHKSTALSPSPPPAKGTPWEARSGWSRRGEPQSGQASFGTQAVCVRGLRRWQACCDQSRPGQTTLCFSTYITRCVRSSRSSAAVGHPPEGRPRSTSDGFSIAKQGHCRFFSAVAVPQ